MCNSEVLQSLRRHPLKLDGEASRLANRVQEQLSLSLSSNAKESEGEEASSLVRN